MKRRIFVVSVAGWLYVSAAAAAGSGEQRGLEEVVVTAQRREERLLDAPIAVSAFTAADLDRAAADDLSDISLLEPSLSTNQVGTGGANVFRRGVVSPQWTGVEEWDALTPRFVASYDLAPQTPLYVSASRGFKSGGFNSVGNEPAVDPEFLWSYEAGLKSRVMNDRLQMELTAFFYDYSDLQVRKGVELATKWSPLDPLLLSVSLAYIDSDYASYDTTVQYVGRS